MNLLTDNLVVKPKNEQEFNEILDFLVKKGLELVGDKQHYYYHSDVYIQAWEGEIYQPILINLRKGYIEITKEELMQENETLQQKKERLEKELKEVEDKIKEEQEFHVDDVVKRTKDFYNSMKEGDFATIKAIASNLSVHLKEYEGSHSKAALVKATPEEAEAFKKSKEEREIQLASGYKIKIIKGGFLDDDGYLYTKNELENIVKSSEIGQYGTRKRNVNIIEATYQIGCQTITLAEIRTGLEIYNKMFPNS